MSRLMRWKKKVKRRPWISDGAEQDGTQNLEHQAGSGPEGASSSTTSTAAAAAAAAAGLSGPAVQLLVSACWTSVKEASLLIGTLAASHAAAWWQQQQHSEREQQQQQRPQVPLQEHLQQLTLGSAQDRIATIDSMSAGPTAAAAAAAAAAAPDLLQASQLSEMGDLLLSLLLTMKHNGAVEKSQPGFLGLAERLLQSPEPCLNGLPGVWLSRCLARVGAAGQCRDDIVRRSAGECCAVKAVAPAPPAPAPAFLRPTCCLTWRGVLLTITLVTPPPPHTHTHTPHPTHCLLLALCMILPWHLFSAAISLHRCFSTVVVDVCCLV